ncbi:extensin-like domain-containing protein [Nitratireductor sp. CH_MIT9313-5]|uniref:extensin-like domain-containing protein n=1 Tax=Nitratireductor sp. CH_MIT9313-5 TaxID=3107764 RepID=UPI00300A38D9
MGRASRTAVQSGIGIVFGYLRKRRVSRQIFIRFGCVVGFFALPALTACSVDAVMRPDIDIGTTKTAAVSSGGGLRNLVPSNPMMMAYPRFNLPRSDNSAMPAEEVSCRRQLKRLGVKYRDLAPINDGGSCGIAYPVEVSSLSGGIEMSPSATLNCQMALTFARWTKNELAPAARTRYLSGISKIKQGSSYSCRRIAGTNVASEHSKGNALDVMAIELNNGKYLDVAKPGFFAFRERSLLNKVRSEGCDYFSTVLGPGYNADHADHFHFDLKNRRNGYVACK